MNVIGIEFCDAGLQCARQGATDPEILDLGGGPGGWPALACQLIDGLRFGREAEALWFIHPRSVSHLFLEKLSHDTSELSGAKGLPLTFSQVAYYFFNDYLRRVTALGGKPDKVVLAVPGRYLRDAASEEQTIGLLLGMASELGLPLVRIVDMGCAALGGTAAREFPRNTPVLHVDVHLHAAEISVYRQDAGLERTHFQAVPQIGYAPILRHLRTSMGNRFLRHTSFDIHEDRRLEQAFFEQTKDFLLSSAAAKDAQYQINTGKRSYQMPVTRAQLGSDLQGFVQTLSQAISAVAEKQGINPGGCVVSLTDRTSHLEGLDAKLRGAGFTRLLHLRPGAAALGAATFAVEWPLVADLADVPVETQVPLARPAAPSQHVEASLTRLFDGESRPHPSHVIIEGIGHPIGANGLVIGTRHTHTVVDVPLPSSFDAVGDYAVRVLRDRDRIRLELPSDPATNATPAELHSGDRLMLQGGGHGTEVLFAYCASGDTARASA